MALQILPKAQSRKPKDSKSRPPEDSVLLDGGLRQPMTITPEQFDVLHNIAGSIEDLTQLTQEHRHPAYTLQILRELFSDVLDGIMNQNATA